MDIPDKSSLDMDNTTSVFSNQILMGTSMDPTCAFSNQILMGTSMDPTCALSGATTPPDGLSDAEHPKSYQVPSRLMTRARARALESEVTSLLSQLPFESYETWLLPQTETLCILRYQGVRHGEAKEQGGSEEEDIREDGEEKGQDNKSPDDSDRHSDDPAAARTIRTTARTIRL
uniref:Uncharacterized protein n=1 Tax=Triticum urartu TaxID=4572 RepID=A0A8R7UK08_TRIUA